MAIAGRCILSLNWRGIFKTPILAIFSRQIKSILFYNLSKVDFETE